VQAAGYDAAGPLLRALAIPTTGTAGQPLSMSVAPLDRWSPLDATSWSFGDGASASATSVTHAYAAPGSYDVTVTGADALVNTTTATRTITITPATAPAPPPGSAPAPAVAVTATVAGLRLSPATFRAARSGPSATTAAAPTATRVSYTLNIAAKARFTVQRATSGRTVSGRCVKPTKSNRPRKRCTRFVVVRGSFTRTRPAGSDRFTFTGRLTGHPLTPGRYRLVATPTANDHAGKASRVSFRIVK
jgi:PKD repeat protein